MDINCLPNDLLRLVFSFLAWDSWFAVLLTSKRWLFYGRITFDPRFNNDSAIQYACESGNMTCLRALLSDSR
jgi:hypothetical protein